MKKLMFMLYLMMFFLMLPGETFEYNLDFPSPKFELRTDHCRITIDGLVNTGLTGEPSLPAYALRILLPPTETVVNVVVTGDAELMELPADIEPVQQQYPLSMLRTIRPDFTRMPEDIRSMSVFPEDRYGNDKLGFFRGFRIYTVLIYPARYLPMASAVSFSRSLHVSVETGIEKSPAQSLSTVRKDPETLRRLADLVVNPRDAVHYRETQRSRDICDYLIVTPREFVDAMTPLADYKNGLGIRTRIESLEDILDSAAGVDDQDRIRNRIIEVYNEEGIDYVLLAGDDEYLPHRGFWLRASALLDEDIPCDIYFFNLDGNWDDDGDGVYGEPFEIDYYGEVYGARAPIDSVEEAQNFVNKQLRYQTDPVSADLNRDLMAGEYLGWANSSRDYMEEIRLGCDLYGFTTVGIPEHIEVVTLYDADDRWNAEDLREIFNGGIHLISHIGHGSVHNALQHYPGDVNTTNLTNDGVTHSYYIIYSQSCYSCSFDNRDAFENESDIDCIAEHFVDLETGAACYIGNTRFGVGSSTNTNGASQHFQREFFDAIYGEGITCIGETQSDSRDDTVPFIVPGSLMQWAFYVTTLLGDPTLDIWTDVPVQVTIQAPASIEVGTASFDLSVSTEDDFTGDVLIGATFGGEVVGSMTVQVGQDVAFNLDTVPEINGTLTIAASGHNVLDAYADITVTGMSLEEGTAIEHARLLPAFPNPVRDEAAISFLLPKEMNARIEIYNVRGQRVKTLVNDHLDAGTHRAFWNGTDGSGKNVSSGVYFYKLRAGEFNSVRKMMLIR